MDGREIAHFLNFVNLGLCFGWGWSAMCRLNAIHDGVMLRVQFLYLFLFVASVFSGLQFFFFGTLAGWADILASLGILGMLWVTVPQWRTGPPAAVLRDGNRAGC